MSTMTTSDSHGVVAGVVRAVRNVSVTLTVPASKSVRDAVRADARRIYGLDVSDDDRAAKVRSRRR